MSQVVVTHADELAYSACGWTGRDGVEAKILHRGSGGGFTAIVRYPTGWRRGVTEYLEADEALLALDGALIINGSIFKSQAYGAFAPGAVRLAAQAPGGAIALCFFSGVPGVHEGMAPPGLHQADRDVRRAGLYFDGWDAGYDRIALPLWQKASARVKLLRREPGGAETFLIGTLPIWRAAKPERYAHDLELFVIEGDLEWDGVRMREHSHAFIPAGTPVGPYASIDGATLLFRSHGPYRAETV